MPFGGFISASSVAVSTSSDVASMDTFIVGAVPVEYSENLNLGTVTLEAFMLGRMRPSVDVFEGTLTATEQAHHKIAARSSIPVHRHEILMAMIIKNLEIVNHN